MLYINHVIKWRWNLSSCMTYINMFNTEQFCFIPRRSNTDLYFLVYSIKRLFYKRHTHTHIPILYTYIHLADPITHLRSLDFIITHRASKSIGHLSLTPTGCSLGYSVLSELGGLGCRKGGQTGLLLGYSY